MNLNFSDLRFTDSNKTSFLSYWFENYSGEYGKEKVTVWLKIPEIQANSYKEIYMYYNNPSATYQGNPKKVFLWYDDFSFDSSNSYLSYDASWNTNKGIVTLGADWQNYEETGFISPKDLKMKNLYIKAKIFLNETSDDLARDGFIEYRHNINDDNKETSWIYGMANSRRTGYNGLTLTKKTKNYLNFIKQDNGYQRQYDKWFNLEVFAYETKHKLGLVPLSDNAGERITWQKYSHHNNQPGSIYFKGENIDSRSGLKLDHIMIGKYKDPNLKVILPEKDFNFESISYNEYPFKGWANQDKITVKNTGNVTSTSSVIKINIDYKEGMHKDFSDVRFVNSDNNQKLPYWNESYVEKESALFWIKIPSIDSGEIKNIDLYYNNPSAVYRGNPKEVFIWYEDFETNSINENINIITQNIDLSTETGEVEIKDNSGILNANLNLKNIYIKARFRLLHEKEDNWIKGGEGTNVAMIDYRFQDYNNFWSFGINNNGICKNDSCYYGPNLNITELGQGFSYWLPPARKIYHDWLNFSAKINDNNHNVGYFTEEDDPSDEIKRELSILDNGINKAGAVRIMVEDSEFRGARFDYILVAPYNPDLKINY